MNAELGLTESVCDFSWTQLDFEASLVNAVLGLTELRVTLAGQSWTLKAALCMQCWD